MYMSVFNTYSKIHGSFAKDVDAVIARIARVEVSGEVASRDGEV
jgi:hypothetical protein